MFPLRKDQQAPKPLPPVFTENATTGIMTADAPKHPVSHPGGHEVLGRYMDSLGLKYHSTRGKYDNTPERSYIVHNPTLEQMQDLGRRFGQEAVVFSHGGDHKLVYTNGPDAGRYRPWLGTHSFSDMEPDNNYTYMPGHGFLSLDFDWNGDTKPLSTGPAPMEDVTPEHAPGDADDRAGQPSAEHEGHIPHPNNYDWHDPVSSNPMLMKEEFPHTGGPPQENPHVNDQAAGKGVHTYAKFAAPYGTITPGVKTDLTHYPYHGKLPAIEKLVADHGYKTYFAGGKYGKPDLANRHYGNGHLQIYDPTPQSGGDFGDEGYTNGWRQIHELAHALTYPAINKIYGEGRRIGKLGVHRSLREAQRAVHWEWLTVHKQRELSEQIGVHIPDEAFNKETNTVLHDAIHRAVTGKFTEPSDEGFNPHPYKVPLEHALGTVQDEATRMGLTDPNATLKKSNLYTVEGDNTLSEKTIPMSEVAKALAKAMRGRIDTYSKGLVALRELELRKSAGTVAPTGPFEVSVPELANCPLCGQVDAPGSCTCLTKAEKGYSQIASLNPKESNEGMRKEPCTGCKAPTVTIGPKHDVVCNKCAGKKSTTKKSEKTPALFEGADQSGKKTPELFDAAKKGANVLGKEEKKANALFAGADKSGKKQPGLFDRAKGGEDVFKDEPNLSLFSGAESKASGEDQLFSGAKKGASPLGKEEMAPGMAPGMGKGEKPFDRSGKTRKESNTAERREGKKAASFTDTCTSYCTEDGKHTLMCENARRAKGIKKSESPLYKSIKAQNLCKGCGKSHQGPRCAEGVKIVKDEIDPQRYHKDVKDQPGPLAKKPKDVGDDEGSGGDITKGKKVGVKKAEVAVPTAKPASGKSPTATPVSKPGKAPGMAAVAKPAMPATGAAPVAKAELQKMAPPGSPRGDALQGAHAAPRAAPAPVAPVQARPHSDFADFTPAGKFTPAGAGVPAAVPKLPGSQIRGTPAMKVGLPGAHLFGAKPLAPAVPPIASQKTS